MGQLVNGVWHDTWYDTAATGGKFVRSTAKFRNWITPDGAPGPTGEGGFEAQSGRYHLYVAYACPWAHRALIFRALKGLDGSHRRLGRASRHAVGGLGVPHRLPGCHRRPALRPALCPRHLSQGRSGISGRVTVPILWDRERETIVSNESSEIIRMFNSAFDRVTGNTDDYWPQDLREGIEPVNARIYDTVNNGVYKAGFATTQEAYDAAVYPLFDSLDWLEQRLSENRYLMGDRLTEADWRLFTTLIRFDPVYHLHFKCNRKRIVDYPNLWGYVRELYQWPGVRGTVNFDHIVRHYHYSHETVNPHRIIPINPVLDHDAPHGRG